MSANFYVKKIGLSSFPSFPFSFVHTITKLDELMNAEKIMHYLSHFGYLFVFYILTGELNFYDKFLCVKKNNCVRRINSLFENT